MDGGDDQNARREDGGGGSSSSDLEASGNGGVGVAPAPATDAAAAAAVAGEEDGSPREPWDDLPEFEALSRFITSYQEGGQAGGSDGDGNRKRWWQFWKSDPEPQKQGGVQKPKTPPEAWLETDIHRGLSPTDVETRRRAFGWNELTTEKENMLAKFAGYFQGPILYVMEVAALLAVGLGDWIDFGVILGILLLNAFVGFYQEKQAADVVASLKGDIELRATVVRDGTEQQILAKEIVPGDIIIIQEGETIPADARLICDYSQPHDFEKFKELKNADKLGDIEAEASDKSGSSHDEKANGGGEKHEEEIPDEDEGKVGEPLVSVDQSAITGESLAVEKYMGDGIYYTTGCKRGKCYAVVQTTARYSFVGRTASLVQGSNDQGHFQAVMQSIGTTLLVLVMFWILVAWIGGFYHHLAIAEPENQSLLDYALVLLIIGVPVGLPVVTTTTLAVGAAYLARQKAIVQKLTAIESLAGVDVLCSDKTGTLTANKLSIREPYVAEGQDVNWMMAVAALASSHNIRSLDPIDKATILSLKRYPKAREILGRGWKTTQFTPFDPVSKRITAECELDGDHYICAKGAPKAILNLTASSKEVMSLYNRKATEFARRGFRSLGVAYKKNNEDWILLGLLSMFDPPREDTAQTIIEAGQLGVPVKMLTGDAIAIAKETCKMLALGTKVYNSQRLMQGGLSGTMQHDLVERADGFAEVFPEHKYNVVEMLQQRGHLTAMTGDGVNDAPSLKKADCGIAVEGASEAAQAAADIVFLAPGLSTIVLSIKTARQIFQRMKAYVQYRIALCLHLEIYLTTSMIIINETIHTDLIVFLALFADLATVAIAYDNAHYEPKPVEWQLPKIWVISVILGILLAAGTWIMRGTMYLDNGGIVENFGSIQEILFLEVALTENWLIFVTRGGNTWPSIQLVGAILGVDIIATCFCLFGWLTSSYTPDTPADGFAGTPHNWTSIVTVVVVWLYSFGVVVFIALAYIVLNRIPWLNDLGRKDRSSRDAKMENILVRLTKVAIEHEHDPESGRDRFFLSEKASAEEEDDE